MTRMVAGTIAAHIGRRSELGASYGMNFRRYLIRADEAWHDRAHHTQSSAPAPSSACFRRRSERVRPSMRADHLASSTPSLHQARRRWETPNALHTRDTVSRQTSGVEMSTADVAKSTASHPTQQPLLHDLAHALGVDYQQYGRDRAEVLVDCGTYIACSSAGLDVAGEAIPYIAGWGEHGGLDAIHHYAETVDINARRIEDAVHDQTDAAPEAAITARAVAPARITTRSAISPAWHRADDACIRGAASAWVAPPVTLALECD